MLAALAWVVAAAAIAQTESSTTASTATAAPALDAPPPLSDEDLALIEAIASEEVAKTETATPARPGAFRLVALDRTQIRAVVPRTIGEALLADPTSLVARRHHVAGDDLLFRGRSATRLDVRLDGLTLAHALTRFDESVELGLVDPWMIDRIEIGGLDRVELTSVTPALGQHFTAFAALPVRSADRSSGAEVQVEAGAGPVALAVMGGYADFGRLRVDGLKDALPWPYQRANVHARAHAGSERAELPTVGFDLDRLTNVDTRVVRDDMRLRTAGFLAGKLRFDFARFEGSGGIQSYLVKRDGQADREISVYEARGLVHVPVGRLALEVDGAIAASDADELGSQYTVTTGARVAGRSDALEASAGLHWVQGKVEADGSTDLADGLTTDGEARLWIDDDIFIGAAWAYAFRMPTVADAIVLDRDDIQPEKSVLIELGPAWVNENAELALEGWVRWIERAIEPLPAGRATYVEGAWLGGADLRAMWQPIPHVELAAAAGITVANKVLAGVSGLTFAGSAAWTSAPGGWSVEVHGRAHVSTGAASDAETPPPRSLAKFERAEWNGVVLGMRGVVPIAAGFVVSLALENALDTTTRGYGGAINEPGVDLRASLSYAY